ncbi:hypothetical protein BDQ17DRAFT_1335174 [Cyathus striatus]|nr:hypothetical protein BDQ17DRAFT_1335174 [Cyathus striatus]
MSMVEDTPRTSAMQGGWGWNLYLRFSWPQCSTEEISKGAVAADLKCPVDHDASKQVSTIWVAMIKGGDTLSVPQVGEDIFHGTVMVFWEHPPHNGSEDVKKFVGFEPDVGSASASTWRGFIGNPLRTMLYKVVPFESSQPLLYDSQSIWYMPWDSLIPHLLFPLLILVLEQGDVVLVSQGLKGSMREGSFLLFLEGHIGPGTMNHVSRGWCSIKGPACGSTPVIGIGSEPDAIGGPNHWALHVGNVFHSLKVRFLLRHLLFGQDFG